MTCRWIRGHVLIRFDNIEEVERMTITISEARRLASRIEEEIFMLIDAKQRGLNTSDKISVLDMVLTFDEATDLMNRLNDLVCMFEVHKFDERDFGDDILNWRKWGF